MDDPGRSGQPARVARSAGIVSVAIFSSRIAGLVREMVMARLFGAGFAYDAYLLGFRIPNLARDLFAEGALSSAFVPTFTRVLDIEGKESASHVANLVTTTIVVAVGAFCAAGIFFASQLVSALAPGFHSVPGKFELAVHLTRVMFPFLLLIALAAQSMGILNASNQFAIPSTASTIFNISSVAIGLLLGYQFGWALHISRIEGMAYGVVAGGCFQVLWQVPSLRKLGFGFKFRFDWRNPHLRQIFRLMGPALLGNAAVQINVMINTNFASRVSDPLRGPDGPVSWLAYAFRFMQLPLGLFGVSFAAAILPSVSRSVNTGNLGEFRNTVSHSLGTVLCMTIPSSAGLILLARPTIGAIFQGGHFDQYDTLQTAIALACYASGLAGYAATKVLNPAFYALSDARTPMWISLLSVVGNVAIAETLLTRFHMGFAALAASTSTVSLLGALSLVWILHVRVKGIGGRYLLNKVLKILIATAAMVLPVWFCTNLLTRQFGSTQAADILNLAVCVPVGVAGFMGVAALLGLEEIRMAAGGLQKLLRKCMTLLHVRILNK